MAARAITIKDKDWFLRPREPGKKGDHLVVSTFTTPEALKTLKSPATPDQVAQALQFTSWTVREWCKEWERTQGKRGLKGHKVRGQWRVYKEDLLAFLFPEVLAAGKG